MGDVKAGAGDPTGAADPELRGPTTGASQAGGAAGPPLVADVFVGAADGRVSAFAQSREDGGLRLVQSSTLAGGIDFMCWGPDQRTLFVSRSDSVAAYAYDPAQASFSWRAEARTGRKGTHVTLDPSGRFVFVAHYHDGALSFVSYAEASGFGAVECFEPGQNAHQSRVDRAGRHVYVPCLGSDHVAQYDLDAGRGTLEPAATPSVYAPGGPRHMDFSPEDDVAYVLTEKSSQLHVFDIEPRTGSLAPRPADSIFMAADGGYHWSSDVHVSRDGRFLYAVNREPSELVRFQVQARGVLERLGAVPLAGAVRNFALNSAGAYLQIGGDDGILLTYRVNAADGGLIRTGSHPDLGKIRTILVRGARSGAAPSPK
jgi:6-phosphogluconolactonase